MSKKIFSCKDATGISPLNSSSSCPILLTLSLISLQATMIRNRLLATLRSEGKDVKDVPPNWVYLNSTLPLLSTSFYQMFTSSFRARSASEIMKEKVELLNKTESEYIRRLKSSKKSAVILTGSTGTLGCYLLQELVKDLDVGTVYAVNRPSSESGLERQRSALIKRGIDPDILSSDRVVMVDADLALPDFGITKDLFEQASLSTLN